MQNIYIKLYHLRYREDDPRSLDAFANRLMCFEVDTIRFASILGD